APPALPSSSVSGGSPAPPCSAITGPPTIRTALTISRPQNCERNAPEAAGTLSLRTAPILLRVRPSDLQNFGARSGFELACVHGHGQHAVIGNGAGQLAEPFIAEPPGSLFLAGLRHSLVSQSQPCRIGGFSAWRPVPQIHEHLRAY